MSKCRFLYQNEITAAAQISVSSSMYGVIGGIFAEQLGSATVQNGGQYSGDVGMEYIVEIDGVAGGKEVGQATFKWSDDGGQTWNEAGVLTQTNPYLMSNGVTVKFTSGAGNDLELADRWSWICKNNYGKQKIFDLDRDTWYQSRTLDNPNTITLNFGAAKNIKACMILDHNISSGAIIRLMGNDSDSWESPAYSQAIMWNSGKIGMYLDQEYQYWRLQISDQSNPDGCFKLGELYLGAYLELLKNFVYGWDQFTDAFETVIQTKHGSKKTTLDYLQEGIAISFQNLAKTDVDLLLALFKTVKNTALGTISPIFFNIESTDPHNFFLVHLNPRFNQVNTYLGLYNVFLELSEVVKSNV